MHRQSGIIAVITENSWWLTIHLCAEGPLASNPSDRFGSRCNAFHSGQERTIAKYADSMLVKRWEHYGSMKCCGANPARP